MNYTPAQARNDYPIRIKRGVVMEMGRKFGLSEHTIRKQIEGGNAPLKGSVYPGDSTQYFDRDEVIAALSGNGGLSTPNLVQPVNALSRASARTDRAASGAAAEMNG